MKNSNVVDFFSKQSFSEITVKDFQTNDDLTEKYGVYLRCILKKDANLIRSLMGDLEFKREQINHLTEEWERAYFEHQEFLKYYLNLLNNPITKRINIEKDAVMIGEDGHIWVIYDHQKTNQNI